MKVILPTNADYRMTTVLSSRPRDSTNFKSNPKSEPLKDEEIQDYQYILHWRWCVSLL